MAEMTINTHRPWVGVTMHVAVPTPQSENPAPEGGCLPTPADGRCAVCLDKILHLPAGQGWVHEDGHKTRLNFSPHIGGADYTDEIQYGVRYGDGEVDEFEDRETAEAKVKFIRSRIGDGDVEASDYEPMTVVTKVVRTYATRETGWAPIEQTEEQD